MNKYERPDIAFLDLIFNCLNIILFLFIFSILLISVKETTENKSQIVQKGEFMIVLEWNKDSEDDLDLWIKDPTGKLVWFRHKDNGLTNLDRDDTGDEVSKSIKINREVAFVRGIMPGEYIVNVQVYRKSGDTKLPYTVNVYKINPFQIIKSYESYVLYMGEEHTIVRFHVDDKGSVSDINNDQIKFVNEKLEEYHR